MKIEKTSESGEISKTGNLYKTEIIAALFDLSARRIQQLTKDGILKTTSVKEGNRKVKRYELVPTIQGYIKYLSEKAQNRPASKSDSENESAKIEADARYKTAKAKMAEMELKELQGELHRAEDVELITNNIVFAVRSMLLALPNRLAIDAHNAKTTAETAEVIKKEVRQILDQLKNLDYDETDYQKLARGRKGWEDEDAEEAE